MVLLSAFQVSSPTRAAAIPHPPKNTVHMPAPLQLVRTAGCISCPILWKIPSIQPFPCYSAVLSGLAPSVLLCTVSICPQVLQLKPYAIIVH